MAVKRNSSGVRSLSDYDIIQEELDILGQNNLISLMSREKEYLYIDKLLTYADIPTFGKNCSTRKDKADMAKPYSAVNIEKRAEKNYLFYYSKDEIIKIEKKRKKDNHFFCETKQSNISLPIEFFSFLDVNQPREGKKTGFDSKRYKFFLVNECIQNSFDENSTNELFKKLGRKNKAKQVILTEGDYTELSIGAGVHGIGTKEDVVFHSLRGNVFAKDKLCILVEKETKDIALYKIYIMFFRNPKYYQIRKLPIPVNVVDVFSDKPEDRIVESRTGQARWRKILAELSQIREDGKEVDYVICPFSLIEVQYPAEETLLRASHIKAYAKCKGKDNKIDENQAYDPDNGFLVTANIDALFDKYLISVNPQTNSIVKSKQLSEKLIDALRIQDKVDPVFISEGKKKYLREHYNEFLEREKKRNSV